MKNLILFLSIFLFACTKGTPVPATPLKTHNELRLEKEFTALKKDFQTLKNETNDDLAKLQLQIIQDRKRTDDLILGAVKGIGAGVRNAFGSFAKSITLTFTSFDTRIKELEKVHHKKIKKKK
ncbi:hypothetical protein L6259_01315 [Candidatus Parcubacteria bacterium]|nr:hypothetical protein [Patescibacteria group bacterium]MCG2693904.1 hypothetical protein [Candidatus Parcubacteria bacterium]